MNQVPATYNAIFHGDFSSHPWLSKLQYRVLGRTGLSVSTISYGGAALGGFYENVDKQEALDTIQESIQSGINYIDTSPWYGESENVIGQAMVGIPRNVYYIGTKAGRNFTPTWDHRFDFSASSVLKSVERSLERLKLDYLDIIQVHDVEFCQDLDVIVKETIPALDSVVRAGKAKFIGITGYDLKFLNDIAKSDEIRGILSTVLSYSRYNFHDTSLLKYASTFSDEGLGVINASPLAMGLFTTTGPPKWHPASEITKEAARNALTIAESNGTTLDRASLGFSLRPMDSAGVATTLVSIPTKKILEENLEIATAPLTKEDRKLYELITEEFQSKKATSWDGVEVSQYKNWMANKSLNS